MNPQVLSAAMAELLAIHQEGKSNRTLLAKTIRDKAELKKTLSLRFRTSVGRVVAATPSLKSIQERQELHMALLRAFPLEARGEDPEILAVAS